MGLLFSQAYFSQPMVAAAVLVHLVTDGTYYLDQKQETIGVQLFDTKEQSHDLGKIVLYSAPSLSLAQSLGTHIHKLSNTPAQFFQDQTKKSACSILQDLSFTKVC